ncbi:PREDICTED: uncharacterized protein LOC105451432 [Wasmannia auropunctata]|uniref:uncharacterized protein LOC105451432 n=1 Tax=Wasmannia auropunctata TaxID=64793 RepID=UPI0005EDF9B7|nr:PREDICTED: uncharacterized protein LOC105451432 [Wasmannia auropunctata]
MIQLEIQYFSLNRILLLIIGLWPYQQSKLTRFQFIFLSTILTAGIIFQLTTLITSKYCASNLIKILSSASYFILTFIKYNFFFINIEAVKELLMQLKNIYNQVKDKNEIAIIEEHSYAARRYTFILTSKAIFSDLGLQLLFKV